jgi:hypothetical protein
VARCPFADWSCRADRAGRTVLWQYHRDQLIGGVGYDVNELHPPDARGVLWRP